MTNARGIENLRAWKRPFLNDIRSLRSNWEFKQEATAMTNGQQCCAHRSGPFCSNAKR